MKTKKILSFMLAIVMAVSTMASLGITVSAGQAATLHAEATCDKYPDAKHVLVTAVDSSNVTVTLYDIDGTKTENQTFPVSYFSEQPTVGEWCFGYFMYYGKCDGNHEKSGGNETYTFLDLEESTADILDSKKLDQNYNLTVTPFTSGSGAVTKVKLSWEITDIGAIRMDNKVWDTAELKWVLASSEADVMNKGTAKFTLENYSSVKVDAKVTFDTAEYAAGKKFTAPTLVFDEDENESTTDDGKITLDTANGNDTYSKTNVPTGKIAVTVTPVNDDFKSVSATSTAAKYGTYTVTIGKAVKAANLVFGSNIKSVTPSVTENKLTINVGDKWSTAIANNSGKTVTVNIGGDSYVCTLGTTTYKQTEYAVLNITNESECIFLCTTTDASKITEENFETYLIPATGNVPESIGAMFIAF